MFDIEALGLEHKERRFCEEYNLDGNGTRAATDAGYSPANARNIASELLRKPNIKQYLDHLRQEKLKTLRVNSADMVKRTLDAANFDIRSLIEYSEDGKLSIKPTSKWSLTAAKMVTSMKADKFGNPEIKIESRFNYLSKACQLLGLDSDINVAIATLEKYGIAIPRRADGSWIMKSESVDADRTSIESTVMNGESSL